MALGEICWHNGSHLSSPKKKKVLLYLFSFITFLRQFNNRDEPDSNGGTRLVKWSVETALLWMYEHHSTTHARYVLSVFYSATADCCRETVNTTPLVLIWPRCYFLGGGDKLLSHRNSLFFYIFAFGCWLTRGDSEWHLQDEHAHTVQADTADKPTSLPFLCFAIEYISTVSHCHSLWQ